MKKLKKFKAAILLGSMALSLTGYKQPEQMASYKVIKEEKNEPSNFAIQKAIIDKKREQYLNKREIFNNYIERFANVYNLDNELINNILHKKTNLFEFKELASKDEEQMKKEAFFIIYDINKNPKEYGINDLNCLKTEKKYEMQNTIRDTVKLYSDIFEVEPNFILAIECWESYYFTAPIATSRNNPGSLRDDGDFYRYENLEQGIIAHINTVKKGYLDKGLTTFSAMNRIYCPDDSEWAYNVNSIYNDLNKDKIVLYDEKEKSLNLKK